MRKLTLIDDILKNNKTIYLKKESSAEMILEKLKVFGVCVIMNFVDCKNLKGLNIEFNKILSTEEKNRKNYINAHIEYPGTECFSLVREKILDSDLLFIKKFFYQDLFKVITQKYFNPYPIDLNDTVYMTYDSYNHDNYLSDWHFDQLHALKFFLYLEDTNESNGAFQFALGSHHDNSFRGRIGKIENKNYVINKTPAEQIRAGYSLNGRAGDLIIFDTNGYHRGGIISKNKIRKILRGHSHKIQESSFKNKILEKWRSSKFNLFQNKSFDNNYFYHVNNEYIPKDSDTSKVKDKTKVKKY